MSKIPILQNFPEINRFLFCLSLQTFVNNQKVNSPYHWKFSLRVFYIEEYFLKPFYTSLPSPQDYMYFLSTSRCGQKFRMRYRMSMIYQSSPHRPKEAQWDEIIMFINIGMLRLRSTDWKSSLMINIVDIKLYNKSRILYMIDDQYDYATEMKNRSFHSLSLRSAE